MTTTTTMTISAGKPKWKVFWDLQCPFSRQNWEKLPEIRSRFEADYDFEIHLTSLAFHPHAFRAQCAANLVALKLGPAAKQTFVDACMARQERYLNAAVGDARPSQVDAIFATVAEEAGVLDETNLTHEYFLRHLSDWDEAVKPAYTEHKIALSYGIYGAPKHVIGEKLMVDTESAWGADEWAAYLKKQSCDQIVSTDCEQE